MIPRPHLRSDLEQAILNIASFSLSPSSEFSFITTALLRLFFSPYIKHHPSYSLWLFVYSVTGLGGENGGEKRTYR